MAALAFARAPLLSETRPVMVAVTIVSALPAPVRDEGAGAATQTPARRRLPAPVPTALAEENGEAEAQAPAAAVEAAPGDAAVSVAARGDVIDAYAGRVWSRLALRRPRSVRGAGVARVVFGLDRQGGVRFARLTASSGAARFDRAALAAVRAAAPYPRPPALLEEDDLVFEAPFDAAGG